MASAPSRQDYFELGRATALLLRDDLNILEGDATEMFLEAGAAMADAYTGYTARRIKATYLDGAQGDDLVELADDHWSVQKKDASSAIVTLKFSRPNANAGGGTIPAGTTVATEKDAQGNEVRFTTDTDIVVGAAELSKTVQATAEIPGSDRGQNVKAGKITRILDTLFDTSFTVTNEDKAAGGNEAEDDETYRERVRDTEKTKERGTAAALERGAREVAGVRTASAVGDELDLWTVYIADAEGNANQALIDQVETELENWIAAGACVDVQAGVPITQAIDVSLTVRAGVDTQVLAEKVRLAIVARVNKLKIGETLSRELIASAAMSVDPDNIIGVTINTPAANVVPSANQVFRITKDDVTVS